MKIRVLKYFITIATREHPVNAKCRHGHYSPFSAHKSIPAVRKNLKIFPTHSTAKIHLQERDKLNGSWSGIQDEEGRVMMVKTLITASSEFMNSLPPEKQKAYLDGSWLHFGACGKAKYPLRCLFIWTRKRIYTYALCRLRPKQAVSEVYKSEPFRVVDRLPWAYVRTMGRVGKRSIFNRNQT